MLPGLRWSGRRARRAHFSRGTFDGPSGICLWQWAAGELRLDPVLSPSVRVGRARSVAACWNALRSVSSLRPRALGDFSSAPTSPQRPLRPGAVTSRRHHRQRGASHEACKERFHAPGAILVDAAESRSAWRRRRLRIEIHLAAGTRAESKLGSEQFPEDRRSVYGVTRDAQRAEVRRHRPFRARTLTKVADAGGPIGDER